MDGLEAFDGLDPAPELAATPAADLDEAMARIRAQYGGPADGAHAPISSGSLILDRALGGGWPAGALVELIGEEGTGKTTLALQALVAAQRAGGAVAYFDVDRAFDGRLAAQVGLDLDGLVLARPEDGEALFEMLEALLESEALAAVVVDSAAGIAPAAEVRGALRIDDAADRERASFIARGLRRLQGPLERAGTLLVLTNQLRLRIDSVWGEGREGTGGRRQRSIAGVRVRLDGVGSAMDGGMPVGRRVRARVLVNRWAPLPPPAELTLLYGSGVDGGAELVAFGLRHGLLRQGAGGLRSVTGSVTDGVTLGRTVEEAVDRLRRENGLADALRARFLAFRAP